MDIQEITRAVGDALNAFPRPPELRWFAVKYPHRQLHAKEFPNGVIGIVYYHRYKCKIPFDVNCELLRLFLNACTPNGLYVYAIEDRKLYLQIKIRRYQP